jgi:hypothetical protein
MEQTECAACGGRWGVMRRLAAVLVLMGMCVAGPVWALDTFVVDFPVASTPQTTCGGRYLVPNLPVWRLYDPIIDLRGVTKFRFMAQGTGSSEDVEFSVQISMDGGQTFVCLGPPDCAVVTIPVGSHALPEPPTPIVALPTNQRVKNAVLRQVIRSISGQFVQITYTIAQLQFYR